MDYHAIHIFPVPRKKVNLTSEDAFAKSLLNNEAVRMKLNNVVKAIENKIADKQANSAIPRAICRALESESFVSDIP